MAHLVVSDELAGHSDLQCSHCALDRIRRVTCTALGFCISENSFARVKIRPACLDCSLYFTLVCTLA